VGTSSEWIRVLELGVSFAGLMLLWDAITLGKSFARWTNLVATALAGFVFGTTLVFGWRLVHGWLALLFAAVLLMFFAVGFMNRRARMRSESLQNLQNPPPPTK